jgi:hypothetical protein
MASIPPLTVASLAGAGSLESLFAGVDSSSDPALEALDRLGQSYEDEVSFLEEQASPSGAYDALGSLAGGASPEAGSDPATQLEQTLAGLLGGGDDPTLTADEQLLDSALPATPLDLYA